jgi:hypothetical protein
MMDVAGKERCSYNRILNNIFYYTVLHQEYEQTAGVSCGTPDSLILAITSLPYR